MNDSYRQYLDLRRKWRIIRLLLAALIVGGGLAALLLARDAAGPTCSGDGAFALRASNLGPIESAWGVQQDSGDDAFRALITDDGYLSTTFGLAAPRWRAFPHIRPDVNTLCLRVMEDGAAVLLVNREIAWRGQVAPSGTFGLATWGAAEVQEQQG